MKQLSFADIQQPAAAALALVCALRADIDPCKSPMQCRWQRSVDQIALRNGFDGNRCGQVFDSDLDRVRFGIGRSHKRKFGVWPHVRFFRRRELTEAGFIAGLRATATAVAPNRTGNEHEQA